MSSHSGGIYRALGHVRSLKTKILLSQAGQDNPIKMATNWMPLWWVFNTDELRPVFLLKSRGLPGGGGQPVVEAGRGKSADERWKKRARKSLEGGKGWDWRERQGQVIKGIACCPKEFTFSKEQKRCRGLLADHQEKRDEAGWHRWQSGERALCKLRRQLTGRSGGEREARGTEKSQRWLWGHLSPK